MSTSKMTMEFINREIKINEVLSRPGRATARMHLPLSNVNKMHTKSQTVILVKPRINNQPKVRSLSMCRQSKKSSRISN